MSPTDITVAVCLVASAVAACVVFYKKPEPKVKSGFTSKFPITEGPQHVLGVLMNRNQRRVIIISLALIGATLFYAIPTLGIPGILLGLVTPLVLWGAAAFVALGSRTEKMQ